LVVLTTGLAVELLVGQQGTDSKETFDLKGRFNVKQFLPPQFQQRWLPSESIRMFSMVIPFQQSLLALKSEEAWTAGVLARTALQ
jgi:hypothetical protein